MNLPRFQALLKPAQGRIPVRAYYYNRTCANFSPQR